MQSDNHGLIFSCCGSSCRGAAAAERVHVEVAQHVRATFCSLQCDSCGLIFSSCGSLCRGEAAAGRVHEELAAALGAIMGVVNMAFFSLAGASLVLVRACPARWGMPIVCIILSCRCGRIGGERGRPHLCYLG